MRLRAVVKKKKSKKKNNDYSKKHEKITVFVSD